MSDYQCYLITVLYDKELLKCAIRVPYNLLTLDEISYPAEYKEKFHSLLPLHVASCGPVVEIESIFEVSVLEKK